MRWPTTVRSNTRLQTGMDYAAHEQTYRNFITLVKGVLGVVVVILILMAIFLA